MKLNKVLSILCSAVIVLSGVSVPNAYADTVDENISVTNTVGYVNDNFEDGDLSDWYFREDEATGTKSATVVTENGNKFLRVSYTGLHSDGNGKVVVYSKKFSDGKFMKDMDNCTVFEMKLRTNGKNLRKYIKYNYPTSGTIATNAYSEMGYNTRVAIAMTDNGKFRATWGDVGGTNPKTFMQGNLETLAPYDLNKWYTIKIVYNNKEAKADTYIYNENGVLLDSYKNKALTAWWFNYYDYNKTQPKVMDSFEDISIQFTNAVTVTDEQFDMDDIRIFNQKALVESKVVPNTDVGIIYNPTELKLVFDAPVTVAEGGITVVDSAGVPVTHTGVYDVDTFTYTASFEPALSEGEYKFVIDPAKSVPVNETGGVIPSMSFKASEIPFISYSTMPPVASNVTAEGRVIPGNVIVADYDYISEGQEGASFYEWYMADSADGEFVKIDNETFKELSVTDAMYGKYIKFKVKPVTLAGLEGTQYYESNAVIPEKAPVADNITFSSELFATGTTIIASYDYTDENGDYDDGTEIGWYVSDSGTEGWSLAKSGKNFYISDEYNGKYVKCVVIPVNKAMYENRGTPAESSVYGPVASVVSLTNKIVNGDFENGTVAPWVDEGIAIDVTDNAYSGNYAMRTSKRTTASHNFHQNINLEAEKTYIMSAMVKSATSESYSGYEAYNWKGTVTKLDRDAEMTVVGEDWKRVTLSFTTTTAGEYAFGYMSFAKFDAQTYIDDIYLGELLITDIETHSISDVTVPQGDDVVKVPVTTGKIFNQFGEADGLTGQKAVVSVPDLPGVSVVNNQVVIDSSANAGNVEITVSCIPSYKGAIQSEYTKTLMLNILPHNDASPKALNVNASGDVVAGGTLTGTYDFYQVEGKADASSVRWMYSDSENGVYYDIPGATSATYVVDAAYADKFIKFAVTPKTADGEVGTDIVSDVIAKATAPVATDVKITGDFKVGGTVTGKYAFKDINKDNESGSIYKWYLSDSKDGAYTQIQGENENTLVFTNEMTDKYIKFSVTPVSDAAPQNGAEVISEAYIGPVAPVVSNITITNNGGRLTASYDYYHPYNARELESYYEWKVDGNVVSTADSSYTVNFSGTKSVTFSVTPVGDTNPSTGKKVSVTVMITGNSGNVGGNTPVGGIVSGGGSSGGSSGGGGGGGSSSSGGGQIASGVISINDVNFDTEENKSEPEQTPVSDIDAHWGKDYIKTMEERGVMKADENGNFNPNKLVTREEMLTYLFKTLKLETTEYSGMFNDVEDGEFGDMLQTMVDNGTISADTMFRPGDSISREEMCKILYISLENAGKLDEVADGLINELSDYSDISDWAVKYVNAMYGIKMMIGVSSDRFAPQENVTKAQAATMLTRIILWVEGE